MSPTWIVLTTTAKEAADELGLSLDAVCSVAALGAVWLVRRSRHDSKPLPVVARVSISADDQVRTAAPRKVAPAYFIIAAVTLGLIGIARPQWGEREEVSFSQSREVMIALDQSRSMWTEDMPGKVSRLRAAKTVISELSRQYARRRHRPGAVCRKPHSCRFPRARTTRSSANSCRLSIRTTCPKAVRTTAACWTQRWRASARSMIANRYLIVLSRR